MEIPYCHHELWNGTGYPRGLREAEIPLVARVFTMVDVWDALSSDRPYRAAWKEETVKEYFVKQAGILFDPELIPLFLETLETFPALNL
jgi:putative two-component system response regulator